MTRKTKKKASAVPAWANDDPGRARWEYLAPPDIASPSKALAPPGVRRLAIEGGWLYQVQCLAFQNDNDDSGALCAAWSPPTFVPR